MSLLSIVGAGAGFLLGGPAGAALGATIGGGIDSANAAKSAASTQASAATQAAQLQQDTANKQLEFQKQQYTEGVARQEPWYTAGVDALKRIQAGIAPGGEFSDKFTGQSLYTDPSYAWRLNQGQRALEQSAAARGVQFSGGTQAALQDYAQNAASQEYQAAYNRFYSDQDRTLNRLGAVASSGSSTASGLANLGANYAANQSNILGTSAANQSNWLTGASNANAAGQIASTNATNNMLNQVLQSKYFTNLSGTTGNAGMTYNPASSTVNAPVDYSLGGAKLNAWG
jgi:hypothetical protein